MSQFRYWLVTLHFPEWEPELFSDQVKYIRGQKEKGSETDREHWQLIVYFKLKVTLSRFKAILKDKYPDTCNKWHLEPSRSDACEKYVWKTETRIGDPFELGMYVSTNIRKSFKRNSDTDWRRVLDLAKEGRLEEIGDTAPDVVVRHYSSLKRIIQDNLRPPRRTGLVVNVYWGDTGTGKTHRAFAEAGEDAYPKGPTSIWWDGYRKETNVVIDEFCGRINIEHMLRWLDWQPVIVEVKGSSCPLHAMSFWITSNINPDEWYNDTNSTSEQRKALKRRLTNVVHFIEPFSN